MLCLSCLLLLLFQALKRIQMLTTQELECRTSMTIWFDVQLLCRIESRRCKQASSCIIYNPVVYDDKPNKMMLLLLWIDLGLSLCGGVFPCFHRGFALSAGCQVTFPLLSRLMRKAWPSWAVRDFRLKSDSFIGLWKPGERVWSAQNCSKRFTAKLLEDW